MATILMVPGLFGNRYVWAKVAFSLSKLNFNCHPVTLPGRKKLSERPGSKLGKMTTQDDINFLLKEMDKIRGNLPKGEPLIGLGHSRGALLILKLQEIFAKEGEKLFDKIILITPAPPKGIKAFSWSGLKGYLSLRPIWWFLGTPVRRTLKGMIYAVMEDGLPASTQKDIYYNSSWESSWVVLETLFRPLEIDPAKINCPVLVIGASQDRLVPPPIAKKITKMFSAEYREVKGPHLVLKDSAREELCQTILKWLWNMQ